MKCRCGCGEDVEEGKQFLKGHWSKFNAQKKAEEPKQEAPKTEESKQETPKITITDIRIYASRSNNVAWFKTETDYIYKEPEFFCTVINETTKEQGNYVAVVLEDGLILPVVMIPGFAGLFPENHEFIEPEEPKTEEKEPIPTENPPRKILPADEKPAISQPDDQINEAIEELRKISNMPKPEKKKGFIGRILGSGTG